MSGLATRLARGPVVLDGGLATELERRGHDLGGGLWSARLLRDAPADIEAVHRAYFEAGADVAITASYQATYEGFAAAGIGAGETARLLRLSVELARRARDAARPDGLVAASVGPYAVVLADGSEYTGEYGDAGAERIAAVHRPRIATLLEAGPDLLALETIPSIREVAALAELLGEFPGVEAWMTFCCRDGARLSDGTPVEDAVRAAAAGGVAAVGVNCTPPEHVDALLDRIRASTALPILVYPNTGFTREPGGFAAGAVAGWRERGARGIGGCCGTGPDTIAAIAATLRG
jgi:homocysteine S-methyltransferase